MIPREAFEGIQLGDQVEWRGEWYTTHGAPDLSNLTVSIIINEDDGMTCPAPWQEIDGLLSRKGGKAA